MESLKTLFPSAEDLVATQPDDLALVLLKLARDHMQRVPNSGMFIPSAVTETSMGTVISISTNPYPPHKKQEVESVLSEGWDWLRTNGLIAPAPDINGRNGWMVITRKGLEISDQQDLEKFKAAKAFPKALLHPAFADKLWPKIMRGDYAEAVLIAFRTVEEAVREAGGFEMDDSGKPMMRLAFNKDNGPLTDSSEPKAERESLMEFFSGAIGYYKNPHSHRTENLELSDAQEQLVIASHLLRIVESRRVKSVS